MILSMKKIILVIVTILWCSYVPLSAQIEMVVDTLELSNVIEKCPNDLYILSGSMMGAYATFKFHIMNTGGDMVEIYTNDDNSYGIGISFRYDGKHYTKGVIWAKFVDHTSDTIIKLSKNQRINIIADAYLIHGCDFFPSVQWTDSNHVMDCTKEVIQILPSLKLHFHNRLIDVFSKEIRNVILSDTYCVDFEDVKQMLLSPEEETDSEGSVPKSTSH